jgi:DNA polymerase-3 subunit delta'
MREDGPAAAAATTELIGHEAAEAAFERALAQGRLPHGWLLTGPEGVGKATLAYRMARRLLAGPDEVARCQDPASAVFRMVAGGHHPDLKVIDEPIRPDGRRLKSNIPVDLVRERLEELYRTAARGGRRVLLVDPPVDLGPSAANALLKTLEEPPDGLVLILVAQSYVRLPATVASRCARLRLRPLPAAQVAAALRRQRPTITAERAALLAELARGSIGRALELDRLDWPAEYARLLAALGQGGGQVLTVAESLLRLAGKGGIREAARLLGDVLRRAAHVAAGRPPACALLADEAALLARLPGAASLDRCVALWDKLARSAAEADQLNLDPLQTLVGIVHGLAAEPARAGGGNRR